MDLQESPLNYYIQMKKRIELWRKNAIRISNNVRQP